MAVVGGTIPCKGFLRTGSRVGSSESSYSCGWPPGYSVSNVGTHARPPALAPCSEKTQCKPPVGLLTHRAKALQRKHGGHTTQHSTFFRCRKRGPKSLCLTPGHLPCQLETHGQNAYVWGFEFKASHQQRKAGRDTDEKGFKLISPLTPKRPLSPRL